MAHDRSVPVAVSHLHSLNRFSECADLVDLNENAVCDAFIDPLCQSRHVGYEQVVAHKLQPITQLIGQLLPSVPVIFRTSVFN